MEDHIKLGIRHWGSIDHIQLNDHLKKHPAMKLMDVVAERDSALLERNMAIAEKKAAYAERDSALLQRDVAYSDRNSALMEQDAAVAALDMVRRQESANEAVTKLMHMVNMAVSFPLLETDVQVMAKDGTDLGIDYAGKSSQKWENHVSSQKKSSTKRKSVQTASQVVKGVISPSKKKKQQQSPCELLAKRDMELKTARIVVHDCSTIPIPYCSCTGTNQQCYRWGDGGWQSTCCTNFISMYPLPVNPKKCGSRLPGRKMSGSAFKKLLEKLATEGADIACPVDLKKHWAKHGTNRYVTIK